MGEKPYVISLPESFPEQVLSNSFYDEGRLKQIANIYSGLTKRTVTRAASSRDALGHLFFREIDSRSDARMFSGMFSPNADLYAFKVPSLDLSGDYNVSEAREFRMMQLAIDIAEARGVKPESVCREASDLLKLFRKR
jgi:hypothetical protein